MSEKTTNISITVPENILEDIDAFVSFKKEETDRTRSKWFVHSIKNEMKKNNFDPKKTKKK